MMEKERDSKKATDFDFEEWSKSLEESAKRGYDKAKESMPDDAVKDEKKVKK